MLKIEIKDPTYTTNEVAEQLRYYCALEGYYCHECGMPNYVCACSVVTDGTAS